MERVRRSYDAIAERYAVEVGDELEDRPLERALLRCFAELTAHVDGPVLDAGCGPGHVTHHLTDLGCEAFGVDVSPRMVKVAATRYPGLRFDTESILELPYDADLAGAVALFSIINLDSRERATAYQELARAVRPGGALFVGFHVSDEEHAPGEVRRLDEWWGEPVELDGYYLDPADVASGLAAAGFQVTARIEREPRPGEYPSRRCYLLATR